MVLVSKVVDEFLRHTEIGFLGSSKTNRILAEDRVPNILTPSRKREF